MFLPCLVISIQERVAADSSANSWIVGRRGLERWNKIGDVENVDILGTLPDARDANEEAESKDDVEILKPSADHRFQRPEWYPLLSIQRILTGCLACIE